jgi:excisionase family DNA binding protein
MKAPANVNATITPRELLERQAFEAFKCFIVTLQQLVSGAEHVAVPLVAAPLASETTSDVLTADEAAVFLGVDRNTVYDYAGRGVIPHQRLGKRILFGRAALVSWLDSSLCKATSTRKG